MNSLTPKQNKVSQVYDNHAVVCALPGSGKTHTAIQLILNIIAKNNGCPVLIVTFTRSAAKEMKERLKKNLTATQLKQAKVATLDSCIVNMAKSYFRGKRFDLLAGPSYTLTMIRIANEFAIQDFTEVSTIIEHYLMQMEEKHFESKLHEDIYQTYQQILASRRVPTFDLKSLAVFIVSKLNEANADIKPFAFSHAIIDEYQDTNMVQYRWIEAHARFGNTKIIGIGDDDQLLFRFNGALGYEAFELLQREHQADTLPIDMCFRCAPNILQFGASIIRKNKNRIEKEFNSLASIPNGTINIYKTIDKLGWISKLIPTQRTNTAILTRNNMVLTEVQNILISYGIKVQRICGLGGFFDNPHAIAFMKLLGVIFINRQPAAIVEVMGWLGESHQVLNDMASIINDAENNSKPIPWEELESIGISDCTLGFIQNKEKWKTNKGGSIHRRIRNIFDHYSHLMPSGSDKVCGHVVDYLGRKAKGDTIEEKLINVFKLIDSVMDDDSEIERDKITLSTLHSAKGLEFNSVFIVDCSEGSIPSPLKESPINAQNDEHLHIEDERRATYVGITRAIRELNITYSKEPSLFLAHADLSLANLISLTEEEDNTSFAE
jgi:DNA helicase-2/ATP-dependent DNA helicase PcrA